MTRHGNGTGRVSRAQQGGPGSLRRCRNRKNCCRWRLLDRVRLHWTRLRRVRRLRYARLSGLSVLRLLLDRVLRSRVLRLGVRSLTLVLRLSILRLGVLRLSMLRLGVLWLGVLLRRGVLLPRRSLGVLPLRLPGRGVLAIAGSLRSVNALRISRL